MRTEIKYDKMTDQQILHFFAETGDENILFSMIYALLSI